jgi:hypothetical protein
LVARLGAFASRGRRALERAQKRQEKPPLPGNARQFFL